MGEAILHPREQCLNEEKKQQAIALGRLGWFAATDSEDHRGASGDDLRLPESRRNRNAAAPRTDHSGKTGQLERQTVCVQTAREPASGSMRRNRAPIYLG
jgi:hypothetical protein